MRTPCLILVLSALWVGPSWSQPAAPAGSAEPPPTLRLCTGPAGNIYHRVGEALRGLLAGAVEVQVVTTRGSWDNLDRLDRTPRRCDAIVAQEDAYALHQFQKPNHTLAIERTATLYPEHVHLLCNKGVKATAIGSLDPAKHSIYLTGRGSGSFITWNLFSTLSARYKALPTVEVELDAGLERLTKDPKPACLFFVSGLGGRTLGSAAQAPAGALRLLPVVDRALHRPVGKEKRQIYAASTITARTYPRLLDGDLDTQTVDAVLFTAPEWRARYPDAARGLARALVTLSARFDALVAEPKAPAVPPAPEAPKTPPPVGQ